MVYPRRCPLCDATYGVRNFAGLNVSPDLRHVTLQAQPGGTPSPWHPGEPGRLLTLHCLLCTGEYGWDYFGGRLPPGEVPTPRQRAAPRRRMPVLTGSRASSAPS